MFILSEKNSNWKKNLQQWSDSTKDTNEKVTRIALPYNHVKTLCKNSVLEINLHILCSTCFVLYCTLIRRTCTYMSIDDMNSIHNVICWDCLRQRNKIIKKTQNNVYAFLSCYILNCNLLIWSNVVWQKSKIPIRRHKWKDLLCLKYTWNKILHGLWNQLAIL